MADKELGNHTVRVTFSFRVDTPEMAEEIVTEFNYGDIVPLETGSHGWGVDDATIDGETLAWG